MKKIAMPAAWVLTLIVLLILGGCGGTEGQASMGGMKNAGSVQTREDAESSLVVDGDGYPMSVTDYLNVTVALDEKPRRVAVLSGTFLNLWYAMGGESVCRTELTSALLDEEYAAAVEALPSVGAVYNPNTEAIVEYQPDLVIAQVGVQSTLSATLRNMGMDVLTLHMRSYEDVLYHIEAFGRLLNNEDYAAQLIDGMEQRKQAITGRLPAEGKSVVILYVTSASLSVKLDNSIAGDVAGILGLHNIASDLPPDSLGSETTPLDIEYVVEQDPDMVLVTSMIASNEAARETMEKEFSENPAWQGVNAIREGRVVYLPQEYFLYNAAHNYVDAIEYMARGVYPDIYGELP